MSENQTNDPTIIKLTNVRLSFPALFEAKAGPDGGKPKFSATFLLDKKRHSADIAAIQAGIKAVIADKWKGKAPGGLKLPLHDGIEKGHLDGYDSSVMFIAARTEKRPSIVRRDLTPIQPEDGVPYAGCYVIATIRLWAQDNQFGKRVNAALRAVMFYKDGEPFGEKPIEAEKEFGTVPEEDGIV